MLCRGGWPASIDMNRQAALKQPKNYVDAVCKRDISRVDNVKRDASFALRLMRSYARNQGGQVPISVMYSDLSSNKDDSLSEETISSYITALRKIFVIEDMPAWNPNLRSKTAILTMPQLSDCQRKVDLHPSPFFIRSFIHPSFHLFLSEIVFFLITIKSHAEPAFCHHKKYF